MRAPCFTLSPKSGPFQGHLSSVLVVPITLLQTLRRSNIKPGENVGKILPYVLIPIPHGTLVSEQRLENAVGLWYVEKSSNRRLSP